MSTGDFELSILRQHWILDDGKDNPEDLCSHGEVYLRIGSEEVATSEDSSWTLTTTGLYLLRTLEQDHEIGGFASQLLPCCGHSIFPSDAGEFPVIIIGCPTGEDWNIRHANGMVIHESEKGSIGSISFEDYRKLVLQFTNEIEAFYGDPKHKVSPISKYEKRGFHLFWKEWHDRKSKWK